jgi:hypothetical protein
MGDLTETDVFPEVVRISHSYLIAGIRTEPFG